ncbi:MULTISPECIES: hypothetical protein [unclassified Roseateles]|uniref:hypothetical protein n=1 Tax=unclassified Roseateles TaxID=2626991 RepID=UPI000700FF89|nr:MULTISPECIES: hypothetical protein [unclassified Roseateles]KQW52109.1 hypothetical protein ASC81_05800 [Pelomonas sp. Root405]KRA78343.1 hypothetical protein ASD88_05805 [Pelomonas sp. Root662]
MLRPAVLLLLAACAANALADPPPEPKVERNVAEDDQVRIEEVKVRGETKKVTVKNKLTKAPDYEIVVTDAGRESAGGSGTGLSKSGSGTRVWRVLNF